MNLTQYIFIYVIVITWLIGIFILAIKLDNHCQLYASGERTWFWYNNEEEHDNQETIVATNI
tara:strand:+ start:506 stop:691 length:186 start_codon:yes stop_codon:yes gene_type:complete